MTSEFTIAVHALVYLNHKGKTLSSEELAENICTNSARIRKVMSKLKKANIVSTKEGIDGGYLFQKNPKTLTLAQISDALSFQFVTPSWHSGDQDMECLVASGMADIMDEIYQKLNQECKKYLKTITIEDIDTFLFGNQQKEGWL